MTRSARRASLGERAPQLYLLTIGRIGEAVDRVVTDADTVVLINQSTGDLLRRPAAKATTRSARVGGNVTRRAPDYETANSSCVRRKRRKSSPPRIRSRSIAVRALAAFLSCKAEITCWCSAAPTYLCSPSRHRAHRLHRAQSGRGRRFLRQHHRLRAVL